MIFATTLFAICFASSPPIIHGSNQSDIAQARFVGSYSSGLFNASGGEIAAWSPQSKMLYVTNAAQGLAMLDMTDPTKPARLMMLRQFGVNSVAVHGDLVAMCWMPKSRNARGEVRFFNLALEPIAKVRVGHGPDMIAFTPDGTTLLVANEAEPSDDGSEDPAGTVSLIDLTNGPTHATVREATFDSFEAQANELRAAGVHAPMPERTLAQQLEPEYISVTLDGTTAYVSLQECNAVAVLDIATAKITAIIPLGLKNFGAHGVGLDASDKDNRISINEWPISGMYQPDSIAYFRSGDEQYIVTANEGEPRDYPFWSELRRVAKLKNSKDPTKPALDEKHFPLHCEGGDGVTQADLLKAEATGRLEVSESCGDIDHDGDYDQLICFGARSASIWRIVAAKDGAPTQLELTWDSGSEIERTVRDRMPDAFNSDSKTSPSQDSRSDARGPEPEGLAIATIAGRRMIFLGLERTGGVMMWDASDPKKPIFAGYFNRRDPRVDLKLDADDDKIPDRLEDAGDLAPEGLCVIPAESSPTGTTLLAVCNETSGTVSLFEIVVAPSQSVPDGASKMKDQQHRAD